MCLLMLMMFLTCVPQLCLTFSSSFLKPFFFLNWSKLWLKIDAMCFWTLILKWISHGEKTQHIHKLLNIYVYIVLSSEWRQSMWSKPSVSALCLWLPKVTHKLTHHFMILPRVTEIYTPPYHCLKSHTNLHTTLWFCLESHRFTHHLITA